MRLPSQTCDDAGVGVERFEDDGWVLRTRDLGEADAIVTLATAEQGLVRGVARSARRSRRRFSGALEPLTRVRATWAEKPGRDLHRIDALEVRRSYASMQADPVVQAACAVIVELTEQVSQEHHADPATDRLIGAVAGALEAGGDALDAVRYYQFWTLRLNGLLPDLRDCGECATAYDAGGGAHVDEAGELRCRDCSRGFDTLRLSPTERSFLLGAARRSPLELLVAPDGGDEAGESEAAAVGRVGSGRALDRLLRRQLEAFCERPLRTLRHLRAALALPTTPTPRGVTETTRTETERARRSR